MTDGRVSTDTRRENATVECASCGDDIDTAIDTHYRIGEEERPVKQLEKATEELELEDWFSRGWYVCEECIGKVIRT